MIDSRSTMRTYRYVRVGIVGAVVLLGVALTAAMLMDGPLRSISAAYYTSARAVFVGALLAVSFGLIVLAGRSLRRFLLLLAGVVAPVIAIVPTAMLSADLERLTGVGCGAGIAQCVPSVVDEGISTGMIAMLTVGAGAVITAVVFAKLDGTLDGDAWIRTAIVALLLAVLASWFVFGFERFRSAAHYVSAGVFFLLIAAVAALRAREVTVGSVAGPGAPRTYAAWYLALAILIVLDVIWVIILAAVNGARGAVADAADPHLMFIAEAIAIGLFAVFWVLQTVENWYEVDPSLLDARPR